MSNKLQFLKKSQLKTTSQKCKLHKKYSEQASPKQPEPSESLEPKEGHLCEYL